MNILHKIKNNNQGFSLTELLVAISILLVMTSLVFMGGSGGSSGTNVKMTAYNLASDIRKIQSYTLNLKEHSSSGDYPEGGWGVFVNKLFPNDQEYREFADLDISGNSRGFDVGDLHYTKKINGPIYIDDILLFDGAATSSKANVHISFEPPDPIVYICTGAIGMVDDTSDCDYVNAQIILRNHDSTVKYKVIVNKLGLIDVE